MAKVKLSLPSGSEIEKPIVSYFSNGGNYLVLDAESVGSMGLPIILVSKITDNKAEKIIDQNEWQQVKGYLKNIISGGATTYLAVPETLSADETYYTQLTLPVASFDALKNSYKVPEAASEPAPEATPASEPAAPATEPVVAEPAAPEAPVAEPAPVEDITTEPAPAAEEAAPADDIVPAVPVIDNPTADSSAMEPVNMSTEEPAAPVIEEAPTAPADQAIVNPIIGEEPIANEGLISSEPAPAEAAPTAEPVIAEPAVPTIDEQPAEPAAPEAPVVAEPTPAGNIDEVKQKFMKACEELFDSLASLK